MLFDSDLPAETIVFTSSDRKHLCETPRLETPISLILWQFGKADRSRYLPPSFNRHWLDADHHHWRKSSSILVFAVCATVNIRSHSHHCRNIIVCRRNSFGFATKNCLNSISPTQIPFLGTSTQSENHHQHFPFSGFLETIIDRSDFLNHHRSHRQFPILVFIDAIIHSTRFPYSSKFQSTVPGSSVHRSSSTVSCIIGVFFDKSRFLNLSSLTSTFPGSQNHQSYHRHFPLLKFIEIIIAVIIIPGSSTLPSSSWLVVICKSKLRYLSGSSSSSESSHH